MFCFSKLTNYKQYAWCLCFHVRKFDNHEYYNNILYFLLIDTRTTIQVLISWEASLYICIWFSWTKKFRERERTWRRGMRWKELMMWCQDFVFTPLMKSLLIFISREKFSRSLFLLNSLSKWIFTNMIHGIFQVRTLITHTHCFLAFSSFVVLLYAT